MPVPGSLTTSYTSNNMNEYSAVGGNRQADYFSDRYFAVAANHCRDNVTY